MTVVRGGRLADAWWTVASRGYDAVVGVVGWHRWQEELVDDLATGSALDVGCGPAHLAGPLRERGVRYVGLDRNWAMLVRARRGRVSGQGPGGLVRGDLRTLPFRSGSFDVVVATGVLGLLDVAERRAALGEIVRVARDEVRLLEPIRRPGVPVRPTRARILAFVRDRPVELDELVGAGLSPQIVGSARLGGVYTMVRATVRRETERAGRPFRSPGGKDHCP